MKSWILHPLFTHPQPPSKTFNTYLEHLQIHPRSLLLWLPWWFHWSYNWLGPLLAHQTLSWRTQVSRVQCLIYGALLTPSLAKGKRRRCQSALWAARPHSQLLQWQLSSLASTVAGASLPSCFALRVRVIILDYYAVRRKDHFSDALQGTTRLGV